MFEERFSGVQVPMFAKVQQSLLDEHIEDPRRNVYEKLNSSGLGRVIEPGSRIAITAGSRGIGGFVELLSGIIDAVHAAGGKPFIVPAMGSHGGATARGQTEILNRLGVNEKSILAPVEATMDTFELGVCKNGARAHIDQIASQADGIIVLGRVKTHPERATGLASGLLKMTTIGLGKQTGAQEAHSHGLWESIEGVSQIILAKSKILFGIAIVENAFRKPMVIEVVPGTYEAFYETDQRLLKIAKPHVAKVPFASLDLLIVDEIGKTISGTGMDLNVIGNWRLKGGSREPDFHRIVALSLTEGSLGNGLGIGLADFTTERFVKKYDPKSTYINLLTATEPDSMNTREGVLPLALPNDRISIKIGLYSSLAAKKPRVCRIKNTAQLHEMWVSEGLMDEVKQNSNLSILEELHPMEFDAAGNLF